MIEQKCYELLGLNIIGNPNTEMTIESLVSAITESTNSRLIGTTMNAQGFTIVHVLDSSCVLAKKDRELLFLTIADDGGYFEASMDSQYLFRLLSAEGLLHDVVPEPIVTELLRLQEIAMADRLARSEKNEQKRDLAELKKLALKLGKSII